MTSTDSVRRVTRRSPLAAIMASYFLLCGAVLPWYLHRVGPDASSYLTIARKYRAWDFQDAVNGYWSPLLSWLVAPLLCLGAPAEVTATFLQVVIGAGALWAVWWLGKRVALPEAIRVWTTLCIVPADAMYALTDTTPDLLVATILVVYVGVVIGTDYPRSLWQGAACGLLGALAYLAKAYAFPFFLAHYLAVSAYLFMRRRTSGEELRRLAAATAMGLLVFAVVAGGWASLLSRKYSRITIGTTGSYQLSLFSGGGGGIFHGGGLFPPSNATAVSAWEDPSDLRTTPRPPARTAPARTPPRRPDAGGPTPKPVAAAHRVPEPPSPSSWDLCQRSLGHIVGNLVRLSWTLFRFLWVSPLILIGLLLSYRLVPRGPERDRCAILFGTLILYPSGYLLIFIQERYLWVMTFLLAVAAGLVATIVPVLSRTPWRFAWGLVAGVSFALWPAWLLVRLGPHALEATPVVASQLGPAIRPGARIASDAEWGLTNSIAYHLDARYYGMLPSDASADEAERQLRQHRIEYLVVWGDPGRFPMLASAKEVPVDIAGDRRLSRVPRVFMVPPPVSNPVESSRRGEGER